MTFFDMTPPKGVNQCRGYPPENRFLEKCVYVFEDIDFWFFCNAPNFGSTNIYIF